MLNQAGVGATLNARHDRKKWSDRFLGEYQTILGTWHGCDPEAVSIASYDDDYRNATDLILPNKMRVAAKTRRARFLYSHPNEIALRHDPTSPYPTEYQKVLEKKADYLLVTYCDLNETHLIAWKLYDLSCLVYADAFSAAQGTEIHIPEKDIHLIVFQAEDLAECGRVLIAKGAPLADSARLS